MDGGVVAQADVRFEFRCSADLLARVDAVRGDVPRSAWIRRATERALEDAVGGLDRPTETVPTQPGPADPGKGSTARSPHPEVPVSEEAPAAAHRATESRERPTPPRSQPKTQRRQKASDTMSAALARQQALNKPKGI